MKKPVVTLDKLLKFSKEEGDDKECHCGGYPDCICDIIRARKEQSKEDNCQHCLEYIATGIMKCAKCNKLFDVNIKKGITYIISKEIPPINIMKNFKLKIL